MSKENPHPHLKVVKSPSQINIKKAFWEMVLNLSLVLAGSLIWLALLFSYNEKMMLEARQVAFTGPFFYLICISILSGFLTEIFPDNPKDSPTKSEIIIAFMLAIFSGLVERFSFNVQPGLLVVNSVAFFIIIRVLINYSKKVKEICNRNDSPKKPSLRKV